MSNNDDYRNQLKENQIDCVAQSDPEFPKSLKSLPKSRLPFNIFVQGKKLDYQNCIAVVGTRKCSDQGANISTEIGQILVENGYTVVSGLAVGIDTAAHNGALSKNGKTIAIVASLPEIYPPENKTLADQIKQDGCIITEHFPKGKDFRLALVKRNEIIAALSDVVVVVESSESGGANYAVNYAQKLDKLVIAIEPKTDNEELVKGFEKFKANGAYTADTADKVLEIIKSGKKGKKENLDKFLKK